MDEIVSGFSWVIFLAAMGLAYLLFRLIVGIHGDASAFSFVLFGAVIAIGLLGRAKAIDARERLMSRNSQPRD